MYLSYTITNYDGIIKYAKIQKASLIKGVIL